MGSEPRAAKIVAGGKPMKHPLIILPLALALSSLTSPQAVNARPQSKSVAERNTPTANTTERNKALVARWADAIWNKDLAVAQALVTDDWVIHGAGANYSRGPEGVKEWQSAVDSNWNYGGSMTDDVIAEGDKVAGRTTVFAMYKPNHRSTVTSVIFIYRIADGKIAEVWRVANYVSTYLQAGARIIMPGAKADTGQTTSAKTQAEQEVLKAKQEFDDAALRNDADGRARFYVDDYVAVYNDGTLGDKAKQLERVRSGRLRFLARTEEDVIVRVYGDTAVVIERRKQTATFDGQPRPSDVRATEVWVKREGGWRLASTSITPVQEPVPGPSLPGRAVGQTARTENSVNEPVRAETGEGIPNGASQAEREVLRAAQEEDEATRRNDVDALARIYGDDYLFVTYAGSVTNKEYQVEAFRSGFMRIPARTPEDVIVRVYGDTAVKITRRKQTATVGLRSGVNREQRVTSVWVKRRGQWQLVSGQVTPILEPAPAQMGSNNASAASQAQQEVLALEEQMETFQRSDSEARIALWAEDLVYIGNNGVAHGKTSHARAVSAGEVKTESLEVTERKIRVYGDVALVTALERMRASFHGKEARDVVQRYTRVWVRRNAKWQVVSFQATKVEDEAAIRKIVADGTDAWNRRDAKSLARGVLGGPSLREP